ncbi:hypothetical protein [Vibrio crassostreae]|uniref:hypothetical protein n=1 Tax=Vibrio crassostreae TaxID=246167 RepID=UPI001B317F61|nr:hypothetical protein [Vibrio crassostreae]
MNKLLEVQPEVQSRTLSSWYDSLMLNQVGEIYTLKEEFDLRKVQHTFSSILRSEDACKIYSITRTYSDAYGTQYRVVDTAEVEKRLEDVMALIHFIHSGAAKRKELNNVDTLLFEDLFKGSEEAVELYNELKEQGIDALTDKGNAQVSEFFWSYKLHTAIGSNHM